TGISSRIAFRTSTSAGNRPSFSTWRIWNTCFHLICRLMRAFAGLTLQASKAALGRVELASALRDTACTAQSARSLALSCIAGQRAMSELEEEFGQLGRKDGRYPPAHLGAPHRAQPDLASV